MGKAEGTKASSSERDTPSVDGLVLKGHTLALGSFAVGTLWRAGVS